MLMAMTHIRLSHRKKERDAPDAAQHDAVDGVRPGAASLPAPVSSVMAALRISATLVRTLFRPVHYFPQTKIAVPRILLQSCRSAIAWFGLSFWRISPMAMRFLAATLG